jgi:ribosomal protein L16 Arg81 hydroxylase
MTFDDVLHPLTTAQFLSDYVGKQWLRTQGARGRFAHLAPWDRINEALSRDRFTGDRVRLVKNGKSIPRESFVLTAADNDGSQIEMKNFLRHLRGGATLVLNSIEELMPPLQRLCEEMEDLFRISIQANGYAGWKTDNGFDLHWDDHDTLILQVAGRKHWRVYEPTRLHPIKDDVAEAPKPTGNPVWDGDLEDGDLLYMPRGWWHVAFPKNEPSLHLTIGLSHRTGSHLVRWISRELKAEELVRADLPHWADAATQETYAEAIGELIRKRVTKDLIAQFMRWNDDHVHARPRINLPADVTTEGASLKPSSVIRLTGDRELHSNGGGAAEDAENTFNFTAMGEEWNCDRELVPALHLLRGHKGTSLQTMLDAVPPPARSALRLQLSVMASGGAITISNG